MKCDMCDCHTSKIVKIRNHKNGNELNICRGCAEWEDCKVLVDDEY